MIHGLFERLRCPGCGCIGPWTISRLLRDDVCAPVLVIKCCGCLRQWLFDEISDCWAEPHQE